MGRSMRTLGIIFAAFALWVGVMVTVSASATAHQSGAPPAKAAATAKTPPPATGYVGEETCLTCHEDQKKGYHGTPHSRAGNPRTPGAKNGCESCHGPGQAHVDADGDKTKIKNPKTLTPREASDTCLSCHNRSGHTDWSGGKHDSRNMSCLTCHSVHAPKAESGQLKTAGVTETCVQCHAKEVNKVHKSSHMPVGAQYGKKMECTTCHNPHGSQNVKMLKEGSSITEACASCHAEKRGPFLWEHAPVRENCLQCHDPHGSNHEKLLVSKQPYLCQRCHLNTRHPGTLYDLRNTLAGAPVAPSGGVGLSNRAVEHACKNCHQNVHGGNAPSGPYLGR
jgi:DmsE family decaheme c-type cytochrome